MMFLIRTGIYSFVLILLISYSAAEKVTDQLKITILKSEIDAWLNLMPGSTPGTIHIAGNITLKNTGENRIENLELTALKVYSGSDEVYSLIPYFNPEIKSSDLSIEKGEENEFTFGSDKGLRIDEKLEKNNA